MNAGRQGRRSHAGGDALKSAAHSLRSSLNGIHTWAHVLESRLHGHDDPQVRRALEGLHAAIGVQVSLIENLLEARNKSTRKGEP